MSWIRLPAFASEEAKQRLSQICGHHSHGASLKCNLLINEKQVVVASWPRRKVENPQFKEVPRTVFVECLSTKKNGRQWITNKYAKQPCIRFRFMYHILSLVKPYAMFCTHGLHTCSRVIRYFFIILNNSLIAEVMSYFEKFWPLTLLPKNLAKIYLKIDSSWAPAQMAPLTCRKQGCRSERSRREAPREWRRWAKPTLDELL
jgi:hypothetical protein